MPLACLHPWQLFLVRLDDCTACQLSALVSYGVIPAEGHLMQVYTPVLALGERVVLKKRRPAVACSGFLVFVQDMNKAETCNS